MQVAWKLGVRGLAIYVLPVLAGLAVACSEATTSVTLSDAAAGGDATPPSIGPAQGVDSSFAVYDGAIGAEVSAEAGPGRLETNDGGIAPSRATLSASFTDTCALRADGTASCWGNAMCGGGPPPSGSFVEVHSASCSAFALQADGTVVNWGAPWGSEGVPPAGAFITISATGYHACGINTDGSVACWGGNTQGESNPPGGTFVAVSAGDDIYSGGYTCGIGTDGMVTCWGDNSYGQSTPPSGTFVALSAGADSACGIKSDGTLACWGNDQYGQSSPPSGTFIAVDAGFWFACGIRDDRTVACWGSNQYGQTAPLAGQFTQIGVGDFYACGIKADGTLGCWGDGFSGAGSPPIGPVTALGKGGTCGIKTDGTVDCWASAPPFLTGTFSQLSPGGDALCGVESDGGIACSGTSVGTLPSGAFTEISALDANNGCGVLAAGSEVCWGALASSDAGAPPAGTFVHVAVGGQSPSQNVFACGIRKDATVACWGDNEFGQSSPPAGTFTGISAGYNFACGLKTGGAVTCWGYFMSTDGYSPDTGASAPAGEFAQISAGDVIACGLKTDGTVVCWGNGLPGAYPIAPSGTYTQVAAGWGWDVPYACALDSFGGEWCWGYNVRQPWSQP
ncbi:MAG: hypothetical protein ABTD50_18030 [Polyangiaceae bacterium]